MNSLNNLIKLIITLKLWKKLDRDSRDISQKSELFMQWKQNKRNMSL